MIFKLQSKTFINFFLSGLLLYGTLFLSLILFLFFTNRDLLNETFFLNWDAQHYFFIKENGYQGFRVAFFPLFPFAWKLIGVSPFIISLLNGSLFIFFASILATAFPIAGKKYFFLALTFPSIIFMFLPYSEAFFFLASTLLLVGLHKKNERLILAGFFLCSLARPVTYIFIPAIFIMEILTASNHKELLRKISLYSCVVIGGLLLTMLIQHQYTGKWFSFFEAQQGWGNYFRFPEIPLNSWAGDNIVRLDATALLIGFISLITIIIWLKKYLQTKSIIPSKAIVFSALYLAGISMFVLFFRGGWLFSLNRFVFATPFFMVGFFYMLSEFRFEIKKMGWILLAVSAFWLLAGSYGHIQTVLKYEALTVYLMLFFLISHPHKNISRISYLLCLAGNIFLFLFFYHRFMNGGWVG